jgi:hypothetical protein
VQADDVLVVGEDVVHVDVDRPSAQLPELGVPAPARGGGGY